MIAMISVLAALWGQAPDSSLTNFGPSGAIPAQPIPPASKNIPAQTTDTASKTVAEQPVATSAPAALEVGPLVPIANAEVGPAGPAATPSAGPKGPAGPTPVSGPGPLVVPGPTYGPTGEAAQPADSATLRRSTAGAMGLSLLLPGMGHRWIGRSKRAPIYHALDLLGVTALVVSWQMGNRSLESATEIANRNAGSSLGSDPDPDLLSAMRNYRSRRPQAGRHDSYDEAMLLSGKSTTWQFPDDASHDWDWGSRENPENDAHIRSFESQLRTWRASNLALYSAAGTLVVLRVVSALDVLRLNRSSAARAGIAFETNPIPSGMESKLAVNF